ncbi:expressed protein [Phakopsora pachyrhizi]|uniref:Expressed protein n=1 Tax=Phakopsora pachyrhizi TaxID=170000 RepID=A0AAV0BHJ4_PHAPC|nr:expressed protein [Phakopsora pachyrhizi]
MLSEFIKSASLQPVGLRKELFKDCNLNLYRILELTLQSIQNCVNPDHPTRLEEQNQAINHLEFLNSWIEINFDERLIKPKNFIFSLISTLSSPMKCGDNIAIEIIRLVLGVDMLSGNKWKLEPRHLETISFAFLEVLKYKNQNYTLVMLNFIKLKCDEFDYNDAYPILMFKFLREKLSNIFSFYAHDLSYFSKLNIPESSTNDLDDNVRIVKKVELEKYCLQLAQSITETLSIQFLNFNEETRNYIRSSSLSQMALKETRRINDLYGNNDEFRVLKSIVDKGVSKNENLSNQKTQTL